MGWMGCVRCEKFRRDCVARTFALVRPVLYWVLYGNQTAPNATKQYETHKNVSLGSNGVDRVHLLPKIPTRLRGTNFCTSSARYAPSLVRQPNGPECTQIVWYASKRQFRVQWGGWGAFVAKNYNATSWHEHLHYVLQQVSRSYETIPNATKYYETHRNISIGSNGVDWLRSLHKIPTWLHVTNFCINCTSSVCFASSFMQLRNNPKCTEI